MAMKETGDPREYEAFVREIDDSRYMLDKDPADQIAPTGTVDQQKY